MYAFEWTPWHTATLCAWVVCVAITGTVYALTRNKAALYVLAALFLPIAGVVWLRSMLSHNVDQTETVDKQPTKPPEYLDEMDSAVPDDDPSVTPERRERAEHGAAEAIRFDDASKRERERIDAELEAELDDILGR